MFSTFGLLGAGLLIGAPVAFTLALSGLAYMLAAGEYPSTFASYLFGALNSTTLLSIPFFILSAEILNRSGATAKLVYMVDAWMGHNRGGLPVVAVLATIFFSTICGSSTATAAAVGSVMIPEMLKRGYNRSYSVGLIATAGGLGIVLPPSIPLIIYGMVTDTSISGLFKAAILPGLALSAMLVVFAYVCGVRSGVEPSPKQPLALRLQRTREAGGVLLLPVIILGGIYSGYFTPTEASAVACVYALLMAAFVYRTPLKQLPSMLTLSASTAGMIMLIIAGASLFSYALTAERLPHGIFESISALNLEGWQLMTALMFFFLVLGMFLEVISVILITMPILIPLLNASQVDLTHFAIVLILNMELAVITPPIGLNLFVISAISKVPVMAVFKGTLPFVGAVLIVLLGLMYLPGALWLTTGW
ncbi:TRAP transporter large permease [Bordetella sp. 2513F-2]